MKHLLALTLCWLLVAAPAHAGRSCQEAATPPEALEKALNLAGQVQILLDGQQAQAAVLARVGSDVSKYGLRYTHAALAYRKSLTEPWTVYHKLNHCGKEDAALFRQGLGNFWLDEPLELRALVAIPSPALQKRLVAAVEADAGKALHENRYSLIAHPYSDSHQNSNGWLLELLAVAEGAPAARHSAQDWLRSHGYQSKRIRIAPHERLGASLFKANVSFLDHPLKNRLRGRYEIVSAESVVDYLATRQALLLQTEVALAQ